MSFCRCEFVLAILFVMIGAAGCDRDSRNSAAPRPREPKHVLATVYPMADIARQVGGDRVSVEWFIESGQPLTEVEATPQRRDTVRIADIVIGRRLTEKWMLDGADDPLNGFRFIRLGLLPSAQDALPDAYVWLDPQVAKELSSEIAKRLAMIDPAGEKSFQDNAQRFAGQLDKMCEEARTKIAAMPRRQFICSTDAFTAFALRVGAEKALASSEPVETLSPQRIRDIRNMARGLGLNTMFVSAEMPPGVIRDLSNKVGLEILTLDPLGTSAPSGRNTYQKLLQYNLDQLIAGLTPKPSK